MKSSEVFSELAKRLGKSKKEVHTLGEKALTIFAEQLIEGHGYTIPRLGTFGVKKRDNHRSFNPFHKKFVIIPDKLVIFC